jgi:hypothetical protein
MWRPIARYAFIYSPISHSDRHHPQILGAQNVHSAACQGEHPNDRIEVSVLISSAGPDAAGAIKNDFVESVAVYFYG